MCLLGKENLQSGNTRPGVQNRKVVKTDLGHTVVLVLLVKRLTETNDILGPKEKD